MDSPLYSICFLDIFSRVASYLSVSEIASLARTSTHFAWFVSETGLLYRHISLAFKHTKFRRKATNDESIRKLLPCLESYPHNAASLNSLSVRHRFSGYMPREEIVYAKRIEAITKLCPNLSSLSLHLSNFTTSYYVSNESIGIPEGAIRAFSGPTITDGETSLLVIDSLLSGLSNLRSLDWCVECRPSGLLSEDWKASRLREELEMIDRACPRLEHLGLLNFYDCRLSDAIIHGIEADVTEKFILDEDNVVSGIFVNLTDLTFYIAQERDQEKILSAAVLAVALRKWRKVCSKLVPWCQDKTSPCLLIQNILHIMKIQELLEHQINISLEEFLAIWGPIHPSINFEIHNNHDLEILRLLSWDAKSTQLALKSDDLNIVLPLQTRSLSIETHLIPLSAIGDLSAPLKLQSLRIHYTYTLRNDTDENVMVLLTRNKPGPFTVEWVSEPIKAFSMPLWGDTVMCNYQYNLFEAVVGKVSGRINWENRKYVEDVICAVFEETSVMSIEMIAAYPLFREELNVPRLFKI